MPVAFQDELVDAFVMKLKRREMNGSNAVALHTAELLRTLVSKRKYNSVGELLQLVRGVGKALEAAHPIELACGNIVRRVLYIVRHETAALVKELEAEQEAGGAAAAGGRLGEQQQTQVDLSLSLHKMIDRQSHADVDSAAGVLDAHAVVSQLKPQVIEEIGVLLDEMRDAETQIAEQAIEHIYAKEIILTFGLSRTVQAFLEAASKIRKFEVIVAESAPSYSGHAQAHALQQLGIETTVISDAAVFALMPSVNKVIIGTHAVMANGGLVAHSGANNIAQAARHHSVPFMVLTALHKLGPLYAFDSDTFNEQGPPSQLLKFDELSFDDAAAGAAAGLLGGGAAAPASSIGTSSSSASELGLLASSSSSLLEHEDAAALITVANPAFDYVEPTLVSLFITNIGGHNPAYIYRLLAEYYTPQDYTL